MSGLFVCFKVSALWNPKFSAIKNTHTYPWFRDQKGLIAHMCKIQGSLKNGVDFWSFVQKTGAICVVALYHSVSVRDQLWALDMTWHLPYAVRSSHIWTKPFCRHALDILEPAHSGKKGEKKSYSYGNSWPLPTSLKARGWFGHIFATSASPINGTSPKKMAMIRSSAVHGGQYETKYVTFE